MENEQKQYLVNVDEDAAKMLDEHTLFLAKVNINAAKKLVDRIEQGFDSLKTMPHRCPKFHITKADENYHQLIIGRYQLIFSVNDEKNIVNIKCILDSRQNNEL